jgi:hypothetical protein
MRTHGLLVVVVIALLAIPVAVAAQENTVTVSGSVSRTITVSVTPDSINFGTFSLGWNEVNETTATTAPTVTASVSGADGDWSVTGSATEPYQIVGYMNTTVPDQWLSRPFYLGHDALSYDTLDSEYPDFMHGSTSGSATARAWLKQEVLAIDKTGTYSIIITFTGYVL